MTRLGRRGWVIALTALAVTLTACGNAQERSLCRQYEDLRESAAQINQLDPETATADDVRSIAAEVAGDLERVAATAEGLYDRSISDLRFALVALEQDAYDQGGASLDEARPLLADSFAATVTAYQALALRLDVVCGTD
jgi:hypothetical protein